MLNGEPPAAASAGGEFLFCHECGVAATPEVADCRSNKLLHGHFSSTLILFEAEITLCRLEIDS
jgi:hypothetical protein